MKYVISDSEFEPIVILGNTQHEFLAKAFGSRVGRAGHFKIINNDVVVYGKSIRFGIESKPEDAKIIQSYLGL